MSVFINSSDHSCPRQLRWDSRFGHYSAEPVADRCSHCHRESDPADSLPKGCAPDLLQGQNTKTCLEIRCLFFFMNYFKAKVICNQIIKVSFRCKNAVGGLSAVIFSFFLSSQDLDHVLCNYRSIFTF